MCHDFTRLSSMLGNLQQIYASLPIAGFPGSHHKQENVLPGVKPAGLTFCPRPNDIATLPEQTALAERRIPYVEVKAHPHCVTGRHNIEPCPRLVEEGSLH